ncbi:YceI family protein [Pedobacter alpinus]|uniref:YceI family protein n=1 Tax=Pedobacter alpinus TaxID=1590643 RepID=A0ABW5TRL0_9SPHI
MKTLQYPLIVSLSIKRSFFVTILLVFTLCKLSAQTTSYQSIPANSSIKVSGSSNIHDWTMKGETLTAGSAFLLKDGKLNDMTALNFSMKVTNLKSDENLLNSRAYKALNAEKFTTVNFKLSSATVTPLANGHYTIKALGKLQISGITKDVVLYADAVQNSDKTISCTGSEKLKMSEYGIKPPSFMLGALKVTDDVTINYNLKFKN